MRIRDRSDRTAVLPGSGELAARQIQPQRPQMRHRRRVAEAAKGQLQRPRADARGAGYVGEPDGLFRIVLDEPLGAADGGRSDRRLGASKARL